MDRINQTQVIEDEIMECLSAKMIDKHEIISFVVESLGVPRPTVRRVKAGLVRKLKRKAEILKSDIAKLEK